MFTGLIEGTGTVAHISANGSSRALTVASALGGDLTPGDSIAVNGVCLTVASCGAMSFDAVVSPETLRVTTVGDFETARAVNLERPLRADDRLGGHFVLGHVDGVGTIRSIRPDGECYWLEVAVPAHVLPYCIPKGSIAIDGISLTIAELLSDAVRVQIVPFTWARTALPAARQGDRVNLEGDVLGKYVARLMSGRAAS